MSENRINHWQKEVDAWASQFDPSYWSPHEILARVTEETGELARLVNHQYGPKKKKSDEKTQEMGEEIGDIFFALMCLANREGINLDEAMEKVMDKCWSRDKDRFTRKPVDTLMVEVSEAEKAKKNLW